MNLIIYSIGALIIAILVFFVAKSRNKNNTSDAFNEKVILLENERSQLEQKLNEIFAEKTRLQQKTEDLIASNASAESKIISLNEVIEKLDKENNQNKSLYLETQKQLYEAKQEAELKNQEIKSFEKRMDDWEKSRVEAINNAKEGEEENIEVIEEYG